MPYGLARTKGYTNPFTTRIVIVEPVAGAGLFFYSPTIGLGTLVGSWAAIAGTDKYGNAYPAGLSIGLTSGSQVLAIPALGTGWQGPGQSTVRILQSKTGRVLNGNSVTVTLNPTTAGTSLAIGILSTGTSGALTISTAMVGATSLSALDSGNDTGLGGTDRWWSYYQQTTSAGETTVTITFSANTYANVQVYEVAGLNSPTTLLHNNASANASTFNSGLTASPSSTAFFWGGLSAFNAATNGQLTGGWIVEGTDTSSPFNAWVYAATIDTVARRFAGNFLDGNSYLNEAGISGLVATGSVTSTLEGVFELSNADSTQTFPGILAAALLNQGLATQEPASIFQSPIAQGGTAFAIQLTSNSNDGSIAPILEFGTVTLVSGVLTFAPIAFINSSGSLIAAQPNTSTAETWHNATLLNSWNGSGSGVNGLFYRKVASPPNTVEIIADIVNATATGNSTCFTLPSGYLPAVSQNHPAAINDFNTAVSVPWVFVNTSGNIQVTGIPVANKSIFFHIFVPLDGSPL